jgi:hypothetical protein
VLYHAVSDWRIHRGVEVTESSTNKQHTLERDDEPRPVWTSLPISEGEPYLVCLLLQDLVQSCLRGGGGYGRTCATRDDEPRPVWTSLTITYKWCVCVFITTGPSTKLFAWGGDMGGHVLRETTSRGLRGLGCPPSRCVCLLLQHLVQSCLHGGGGGDMGGHVIRETTSRGLCGLGCPSRTQCVCLLLQDLVQSCLHGGGGDMGGHVLRETTSRGLCGLGCPSRTVCVCVLLLQDLLQSCVCVYYCRT